MLERVMVVSGAFATHTAKLYNYYVCPRSWDVEDVGYIAVVYFGELKFLGKINRQINWSLNGAERTFNGLSGNQLDRQIINDLQKFNSILNNGEHYLFELSSIFNNSSSQENLSYQGRGAFTRSHRYFETLGSFFDVLLNLMTDEQNIPPMNFSSINDGIEDTYLS
jgi:hypothetical protein